MTPIGHIHTDINASPPCSCELVSRCVKMDIDLELHCYKFYNKDIEVKHTYFLIIPGEQDTTTIDVKLDQSAELNEETVKHWINQPWYHHCIIEKYHMTETKNKLPVSKKNPFKRLWTK